MENVCLILSVFCNKSNDNRLNGSEDSKLPYRQQVIRALVQRYIESARREFEETKRKGNTDAVLSRHSRNLTCDLCCMSCCKNVIIYD